MSRKFSSHVRNISTGSYTNSRPVTTHEGFTRKTKDTTTIFQEAVTRPVLQHDTLQKTTVQPKKRPYKFGMKTLGTRKPKGVNSNPWLPNLYITKATKFIPPTNSTISYDVQTRPRMPSQGKGKLMSGYAFERRATAQVKSRTANQEAMRKRGNYSFDVGIGLDHSLLDFSPTRHRIRTNNTNHANTDENYASELNDESDKTHYSGSRREKNSLDLYSKTNTNPHTSRKETSPAISQELYSMKPVEYKLEKEFEDDDVIYDKGFIQTSPDNYSVDKREITTKIDDSSLMERVIYNKDEEKNVNWTFTGVPISNMNDIMSLEYETVETQESFQLDRPKSKNSKMRQTYKDDFFKIVYKGIGRNFKGYQLENNFLENCEENRMNFKRKLQAFKTIKPR